MFGLCIKDLPHIPSHTLVMSGGTLVDISMRAKLNSSGNEAATRLSMKPPEVFNFTYAVVPENHYFVF